MAQTRRLQTRAGLVLLWICFLACTSSDFPPAHGNGAVKMPPKPAAVPAPPSQVDTRWTLLPPLFVASDPAAVIARLQTPHLDQYETTAAYANRVAEKGDTATLAFVLPSSSPEYDADERRFVFGLQPIEVNGSDDAGDHLFGAALTWNEQVLGTYPASNSLGAQVTVTRKRLDVIAVALPQSIDDIYPLLSMAPDSARAVAPHLRFLILVKPHQLRTGEFVTDSTKEKRPTLGHPTDFVTHLQTLWVSSIAFWVFDEESRRVLLKKTVK